MKIEKKDTKNKLAVFEGKQIRKTLHNDEWWFVIEDIVAVLTDSVQPKGYIKDMRRRDKELAKGWGQIATPLEMLAKDGKIRKVNSVNIVVQAKGIADSIGARVSADNSYHL